MSSMDVCMLQDQADFRLFKVQGGTINHAALIEQCALEIFRRIPRGGNPHIDQTSLSYSSGAEVSAPGLPYCPVAWSESARHDVDLLIDEDDLSLWKWQHLQAEQLRPNLEAVGQTSTNRDPVVTLLLSCVDFRWIGESVVHLAVCLLDRFLAASVSNPSVTCDNSTVFAAMYIAAKTIGGENDNMVPRLKNIIAYYGNGHPTPRDIHRAEVLILNTLKGRFHMPTPFDFLESWMKVLTQTVDPAIVLFVKCHSTHFLTLALKDAKLYHSFPYIDLAAGAIYAAFQIMAPVQHEHPKVVLKILQEVTRKVAENTAFENSIESLNHNFP